MEIPNFKTEAEKRAFWENPAYDSSDYCDWSKGQRVRFANLEPSREVRPDGTTK